MGQGRKRKPALITSSRTSVRDRLAYGDEAGGGAGGSSATQIDPCTSQREVEIELHGVAVKPGDPIHVVVGSPPYATTPAGTVGPLRAAGATQVEACMRVGFAFDGVITLVGSTTAKALVTGR